jgi:hypothetical protein
VLELLTAGVLVLPGGAAVCRGCYPVTCSCCIALGDEKQFIPAGSERSIPERSQRTFTTCAFTFTEMTNNPTQSYYTVSFRLSCANIYR